MIYFAIFALIIFTELLYKKPLYKFSINKIIPDLQKNNISDTATWYKIIFFLSNGNELILLFLYHMIISGKYHRAFLVSIFVS